MSVLILEQTLNGLQFGLMLFLLAAGLTLVFGIMDMINLAHGSLYMIGAYLRRVRSRRRPDLSCWRSLAAVVGTAVIGVVLEAHGAAPTLHARPSVAGARHLCAAADLQRSRCA